MYRNASADDDRAVTDRSRLSLNAAQGAVLLAEGRRDVVDVVDVVDVADVDRPGTDLEEERLVGRALHGIFAARSGRTVVLSVSCRWQKLQCA